jgi:hypothetical protein
MEALRFKSDDFRPYLYKTNDYVETWQEINGGIPEADFTRTIREDPAKRGLLYCATENGVYVSTNGGESWESLQRNLPIVQVHDLVVKDNDLVAGTHGRSMWILDDLTPLQQSVGAASIGNEPRLVRPRSAYRLLHQEPANKSVEGMNYMGRIFGLPAAYHDRKTADGNVSRTMLDAGENPPDGVGVTFYLPDEIPEVVSLTFLDGEGREIKTFVTSAEDEALRVSPGVNRFLWDMQYPGAHEL